MYETRDRFTVNRRLKRREGLPVRRYRYRTAVLTGPWRDSEREAIGDAVRARQAEADEGAPVRWVVPGRIEEEKVSAAEKKVANRAR